MKYSGHALATGLFGAALLFVAWKGNFENESYRTWAAGAGVVLLLVALLLTPRPPKR